MKYIIYHQVKQGVDCPDGIMAASIAQLANPDFELIGDWYASTGPILPEPIGKGDELIIVDFSYPAETLNYWEEVGCRITLIDHHAPKFPEIEAFSGAILDANECGATLTWKHFFPNQPAPEILAHVRRRDIGADGYYKAPENCLDSKQITTALSKGRSESSDAIKYLQSWLIASAEDIEALRVRGEELQAKDAARAEAIAQSAHQTTLPIADDAVFLSSKEELEEELHSLKNDLRPRAIAKRLQTLERIKVLYEARQSLADGVQCWKVSIEDSKDDRLVSLIGAAICQKVGEGTIAWIVASSGENSLRSNGVNIEPYAKALGGGGHAQAAGFK